MKMRAILLMSAIAVTIAQAQDSTTTTTTTSASANSSITTTPSAILSTQPSSSITTLNSTTTVASNDITSTTPSATQNQVVKNTLKPPVNRKAASKGEKQKPVKPYPKDLSALGSTNSALTTTSSTNTGSQDAPPTMSKTKSASTVNNNINNNNIPNSANLHACGPNPNSHVVINELRVRRIDFIELYGEPGTNLDGLYVLSVYHNGTVRVAIPLDGNVIPEDGYFFLSEHNDIVNGEAPDLVVPVFGANSRRHSTILLVCNYQGLPFGEVLDVDGDCQFDSQPWDKILDSVGLANARKGECTYSPTILDSASSRCFCHIYREPDQVGDFVPNPTSPFGRDSPLDSPGRPNVSSKKQ